MIYIIKYNIISVKSELGTIFLYSYALISENKTHEYKDYKTKIIEINIKKLNENLSNKTPNQ